MKKGGKRKEEPVKGWSGAATSMAKGSVTAFVVTGVLLLVCAGLVSGGWVSQNGMMRYSPAACVLGAAVGGLVSICGHRELALPMGVGTGAGLFLLLLLLGLALSGDLPQWDAMPVILCACMCGGTMAGILGRRKGKKKRRR